MSMESVQHDFEERVGAEIRLVSAGADRYRVSSPFQFDDGDHFVIVLKREGDRWVLTDEAHTLMHLSYWVQEEELGREDVLAAIDRLLSAYAVQRRNGEFTLPIIGEEYGKALFGFIRALVKVIDYVMLPAISVRKPRAESLGQAAA